MKRLSIFSLALCLLIGFLVGIIAPTPWSGSNEVGLPAIGGGTINTRSAFNEAGSSSASTLAAEPLDPSDNIPLLNSAGIVLRSLKEKDYTTLSSLVHPTKGVTFTPYSTVNFETNLTFSADEIRTLASDKTVYTWGSLDGRGSLIELTFPAYLEQFVFHVDYTQAPQIGIDRIILSGNALENLTEAYPNCRFVDFTFPSVAPENQGLDWCSLKLVFEAGETAWSLVGIIHSQWTI